MVVMMNRECTSKNQTAQIFCVNLYLSGSTKRYPRSFALDIEQVISEAEPGIKGEFANRDALGGVDVGVGHVANVPASRQKQSVNMLARVFFAGYCRGHPFLRYGAHRW